MSSDVAALYVVKGGGNPKKITTEFFVRTFYPSVDGKTIYFFKDYDDDELTGTLYKYTYGQSQPVKISDSVIVKSLESGYKYDCLSDDGFSYKRMVSKHDYNWMFYDGRESSVQVKALKR